MDVRILVAGLALVGLTACSSPAPMTTTVPAPLPESSSAPAPTEVASTPPQTTAPVDNLSDIKTYGPSSKECTSASGSLQEALKIGILASQGKVTQDDFDKAYGGTESNDLPIEAVPFWADLKTASAKVVGLDMQKAQEHLSEFSAALGTFTAVTQKICS
jgi:hypothetical protein